MPAKKTEMRRRVTLFVLQREQSQLSISRYATREVWVDGALFHCLFTTNALQD